MKLKKVFAFILCAAMIMAFAVPQSMGANVPKNLIVKVGLVYGSDAKDSFNLFYDAGGYHVGYLDGAGNAVVVYESSARFVAIANDKNYNHSGNTLTAGGTKIGAYHVQLADTYSTQAQAYNAAVNVGGFVAYVNGAYRVRFGNFTTLADAQWYAEKYAGAAGVGGSGTCFTMIEMNEGKVIFELDVNGVDKFYIDPVNYGGVKPVVKNGSTNYNGGFEMYRTSSGKMNLINLVPVNDYVKGVVPYEMSDSWPVEALKAQAVAARCYLYNNMGRHSASGFMICANTHCQMYGGCSRAGANTISAVDSTDGIVLTYKGEVVNCYYHASSGGYTENSENVWSSAVPYLRGVESSYEDLDHATYGRWTKTITKEDVRAKLNAGGYNMGEITSFYVSEFTPTGNVYSVTATDVNGKSVTISKEAVRLKLSPYVHSQRFTITSGTQAQAPVQSGSSVYARSADGVSDIGSAYDTAAITSGGIERVENQTPVAMSSGGKNTLGASQNTSAQAVSGDTYTITGTGYGNNMGMSQEGAKGMALAGFNYEQILTHYYTGTSVEYLK